MDPPGKCKFAKSDCILHCSFGPAPPYRPACDHRRIYYFFPPHFIAIISSRSMTVPQPGTANQILGGQWHIESGDVNLSEWTAVKSSSPRMNGEQRTSEMRICGKRTSIFVHDEKQKEEKKASSCIGWGATEIVMVIVVMSFSHSLQFTHSITSQSVSHSVSEPLSQSVTQPLSPQGLQTKQHQQQSGSM